MLPRVTILAEYLRYFNARHIYTRTNQGSTPREYGLEFFIFLKEDVAIKSGCRLFGIV